MSRAVGLEDQTVLIIRRPSGIAGAIVNVTRDAGAKVIFAGLTAG